MGGIEGDHGDLGLTSPLSLTERSVVGSPPTSLLVILRSLAKMVARSRCSWEGYGQLPAKAKTNQYRLTRQQLLRMIKNTHLVTRGDFQRREARGGGVYFELGGGVLSFKHSQAPEVYVQATNDHPSSPHPNCFMGGACGLTRHIPGSTY